MSNYLTSESTARNMVKSETSGDSGPDSWGILSNLWKLIQLVLDESAPALEGLGLTPKVFVLLASVEEYPFPAELARLMHLPPPTVTYMVKQLESLGMIERKAEPGDLRKFRLVITAAGRKAIEQGRESIGAVMTARIAALKPAEVVVFDRLVSSLASGPDRAG